MNKRVALWDNLKLFLIFLVVVGHLTRQYFDEDPLFTIITMVVYTFHMPAFVFVSGLFSKHSINTNVPPTKKIFGFLVICYLTRILTYASNIVFGVRSTFDLLSIEDVPWYMMAMAFWYALCWLSRRVDTKYMLVITTSLACFAGYMSGKADFLCVLRVVTFFPFFYCGYAMDISRIERFTAKRVVRCFSAVYFVGFVAVIILLGDKVNWLFPLLTGRSKYSALGPFRDWGCLMRMGYFVVAALLIVAVISLCPRRELPFSKMGRNTLQIYCLHRPILYIMKNAGLFYLIKQIGTGWECVALALMALLTVLLSFDLLSKPFNYLLKPKEKKLYGATK